MSTLGNGIDQAITSPRGRRGEEAFRFIKSSDNVGPYFWVPGRWDWRADDRRGRYKFCTRTETPPIQYVMVCRHLPVIGVRDSVDASYLFGTRYCTPDDIP